MKFKILHFFALISPLVAATELHQLNLAELTKKAEQGDPMAQAMLGTAYHFGQTKEYLEKDYAKALYWYKKSAEQGNAIAHYQLGNMYQFGRGVAKDGKKAFEWHLKAAELGDSSSQTTVAFAYYQGDWVPKDDAKAFYWFKKSAEQGLNYDMLGTFYYHGIGTVRNNEKAFENFIKAHQIEPKKASLQEQLAIMYEFGQGTSADPHRAFHLYRQAADQGKAYSQYRLGYFYQHGKVASQNLEMAEAYYRLSCKNGGKPACEMLQKFLLKN